MSRRLRLRPARPPPTAGSAHAAGGGSTQISASEQRAVRSSTRPSRSTSQTTLKRPQPSRSSRRTSAKRPYNNNNDDDDIDNDVDIEQSDRGNGDDDDDDDDGDDDMDDFIVNDEDDDDDDGDDDDDEDDDDTASNVTPSFRIRIGVPNRRSVDGSISTSPLRPAHHDEPAPLEEQDHTILFPNLNVTEPIRVLYTNSSSATTHNDQPQPDRTGSPGRRPRVSDQPQFVDVTTNTDVRVLDVIPQLPTPPMDLPKIKYTKTVSLAARELARSESTDSTQSKDQNDSQAQITTLIDTDMDEYALEVRQTAETHCDLFYREMVERKAVMALRTSGFYQGYTSEVPIATASVNGDIPLVKYVPSNMLDQELSTEYDMDEIDLAFINSYCPTVSYNLFEKFMDLFEKEWHRFYLDTAVPRTSVAMDNNCAVCGEDEAFNSNAIVFCDGCDVGVHQDCYGVPYIPEGQWLCRKCMHGGVNAAVACPFCPVQGGAFKRTDEGSWAHLACALWIPETGVANTTFMEPIVGIKDIPKSRWKLICYLCKQKVGAPIQCSNKNCYTAFHASCAKQVGLYMHLEDRECFCDKHTPKPTPVNPDQLTGQKLIERIKRYQNQWKQRGIPTKLARGDSTASLKSSDPAASSAAAAAIVASAIPRVRGEMAILPQFVVEKVVDQINMIQYNQYAQCMAPPSRIPILGNLEQQQQQQMSARDTVEVKKDDDKMDDRTQIPTPITGAGSAAPSSVETDGPVSVPDTKQVKQEGGINIISMQATPVITPEAAARGVPELAHWNENTRLANADVNDPNAEFQPIAGVEILPREVLLELAKLFSRYWSVKRRATQGAPLIKRLYVEPWTIRTVAPTSATTSRRNVPLMETNLTPEESADLEKRMGVATYLRKDLAHVRILADYVCKREKCKAKLLDEQLDFMEMILTPITTYMRHVLDRVQAWDLEDVFLEPVPAEIVPDYYDIIKEPMDFQTMRKNLDLLLYDNDIELFENHLRLIFNNAILYNRPETSYSKLAKRLLVMIEEEFKVLRSLKKNIAERRMTDKRFKDTGKRSAYMPMPFQLPDNILDFVFSGPYSFDDEEFDKLNEERINEIQRQTSELEAKLQEEEDKQKKAEELEAEKKIAVQLEAEKKDAVAENDENKEDGVENVDDEGEASVEATKENHEESSKNTGEEAEEAMDIDVDTPAEVKDSTTTTTTVPEVVNVVPQVQSGLPGAASGIHGSVNTTTTTAMPSAANIQNNELLSRISFALRGSKRELKLWQLPNFRVYKNVFPIDRKTGKQLEFDVPDPTHIGADGNPAYTPNPVMKRVDGTKATDANVKEGDMIKGILFDERVVLRKATPKNPEDVNDSRNVNGGLDPSLPRRLATYFNENPIPDPEDVKYTLSHDRRKDRDQIKRVDSRQDKKRKREEENARKRIRERLRRERIRQEKREAELRAAAGK